MEKRERATAQSRKMSEKTKRDLRGCMTCCGCTRFVNKYRDRVSCFGDEILAVYSEAIEGQVNKGQ